MKGMIFLSRFENDLSKGNVVKQLIIFAFPFIVSNFIQSLYSVADMVIVGQFCGTYSMSGVNIGSQITLLVTNLVIGLSAGATVLIGQYLGAGDKDALKETIGTLFSTLIVLGIIMTAIMFFLRTPILRLVKTPGQAFEEAQSYLLITSLGTIFIFGYNALSAVMRGMGDSKNPLKFVAVACIINIVLDIIMVAGFKWAAFGAGLATIISQAASMILCIIYLRKNNFIFDFSLSSFKFHEERLNVLLKVGVPTSIQNVATTVSFLFLTAMVNSIGVTESAALGAVGKFNAFAVLPPLAMSSAISAMCAHNIGAGEEKRAVKTLFTGMVISVIMSASVFALSRIFPAQIMRMFADDSEMVAAGMIYLSSFSFDYIIVPFVFSLNGLFIGSGHTTFSLINGVLSAILIRIPAAYFFGFIMKMGLFGVGLGAPAASLISLILGILFFISGKWKKSTFIESKASEI